MRDVNISWVLPTTRESGFDLDPADIAEVEISISADLGANWTVLNTVAPPTLELLSPDMEVGDWMFEGVVIDVDGRRSPSVSASVNIPDESPPGSLTTLSAVLV